jgi:purine-cytosine permease-like protein
MNESTHKIIYTIGLIVLTLVIGLRIQALIQVQNNDTFSALVGWVIVLVYFIAYNNSRNN